MRKIKDCIKDSVKRWGNGMLPICLSGFLQSMTVILLMDCDQRLMIDNPDVSIGKDKYEGKAKTTPTLLDYTKVLMGDDILRYTSQSMQLQGFIDWFIEQDEPEDEDDFILWYDSDFVIEKWNEYAKIKMEGSE